VQLHFSELVLGHSSPVIYAGIRDTHHYNYLTDQPVLPHLHLNPSTSFLHSTAHSNYPTLTYVSLLSLTIMPVATSYYGS
jgi:hypothetical protein